MKQKDYPVYKGQELAVTIEGYTSEGQGVARGWRSLCAAVWPGNG